MSTLAGADQCGGVFHPARGTVVIKAVDSAGLNGAMHVLVGFPGSAALQVTRAGSGFDFQAANLGSITVQNSAGTRAFTSQVRGSVNNNTLTGTQTWQTTSDTPYTQTLNLNGTKM